MSSDEKQSIELIDKKYQQIKHIAERNIKKNRVPIKEQEKKVFRLSQKITKNQ